MVHTKIYYLIGMMGAGKSVIGIGAAQKLNIPFVDLDEQITGAEGKSISEIFNFYGEEYFRELEKKYLQNMSLREENCVIVSTGGGAPAFFDNMEFMNKNGRTIWVDTPLPLIFQRLKGMNAERPLIAQFEGSVLEEQLTLIYESRAPIYGKAHLRIENIGDAHDVIRLLVNVIINDLKK